MIEHKIGGLPVVESDYMVVGIVTESDLFEALVDLLDEADTARSDEAGSSEHRE